MKKSELKQIIKEEINEVFGWSKKEKEERAFKEKLEKAEKEIDSYNPNRLFVEPAINSDNNKLNQLIKERLYRAKIELPTVYELMPSLFDGDNEEKIGALTAFYKYPPAKGGRIKGIIPSSFWFILNQYTILPREKANEKMKNQLRIFVDRKYNQGEPKYNK
jgi:hypothetical protein